MNPNICTSKILYLKGPAFDTTLQSILLFIPLWKWMWKTVIWRTVELNVFLIRLTNFCFIISGFKAELTLYCHTVLSLFSWKGIQRKRKWDGIHLCWKAQCWKSTSSFIQTLESSREILYCIMFYVSLEILENRYRSWLFHLFNVTCWHIWACPLLFDTSVLQRCHEVSVPSSFTALMQPHCNLKVGEFK